MEEGIKKYQCGRNREGATYCERSRLNSKTIPDAHLIKLCLQLHFENRDLKLSLAKCNAGGSSIVAPTAFFQIDVDENKKPIKYLEAGGKCYVYLKKYRPQVQRSFFNIYTEVDT